MGRLGEKPLLILGTLLINQMFHCHAQTIIKIVLALVAPLFGTVFPVTKGSRVSEAI